MIVRFACTVEIALNFMFFKSRNADEGNYKPNVK
jgi:hypothetical protein